MPCFACSGCFLNKCLCLMQRPQSHCSLRIRWKMGCLTHDTWRSLKMANHEKPQKTSNKIDETQFQYISTNCIQLSSILANICMSSPKQTSADDLMTILWLGSTWQVGIHVALRLDPHGIARIDLYNIRYFILI